MDIYEFINSRDIREHLKAKQYTFDPLQQAFLVWQSGRHTLKQKHEANRHRISEWIVNQGNQKEALPL